MSVEEWLGAVPNSHFDVRRDRSGAVAAVRLLNKPAWLMRGPSIVLDFLDTFYYCPSWVHSARVDIADMYVPFSVTPTSPHLEKVLAFIQANGLAVALWCNVHMIFDVIAIAKSDVGEQV